MILAHRIALAPTAKQRRRFARACGVRRFAYNWALEQWKAQREAGGKPNANALNHQFNAIKRAEFPFVTEVSKCVAQHAIVGDLNEAFGRFFRKEAHHPHFKKKDAGRDSFYVSNDQFEVSGQRVRLPKVGWVRLYEPLRFRGKVLSGTVSRTAGRWFLSVAVEIESVHDREKCDFVSPVDKWPSATYPDSVVGIDLGLTTFVTVHDGMSTTKTEAPKPLRVAQKRLRRAQRAQSRRFKRGAKRQSNRYMKQKRRIARIHARIAAQRADFLHKLTHRLAKTHGAVVIEDLNVKGMSRGLRLGKSVADASFAEFRRQLTYKLPRHGGQLVVVDRFFPSSKTCSACGAVKATLALSERAFICEACGLLIDRDENAAQNLRQEGLRLIKQGTASSAGTGRPSGLSNARGDLGFGRDRKVTTKPGRRSENRKVAS